MTGSPYRQLGLLAVLLAADWVLPAPVSIGLRVLVTPLLALVIGGALVQFHGTRPGLWMEAGAAALAVGLALAGVVLWSEGFEGGAISVFLASAAFLGALVVIAVRARGS
jgi:hypothetical protein